MGNVVYIAEVHGRVIKVADSFQEAYESLPEVEINVCFGPNKRKIGIVYQREKNCINNPYNGKKGEREL